MRKSSTNPISRFVARFMARLSTFGPTVPNGSVIPSDAKPIPFKDDDVEMDMEPTTSPAGDGADKSGTSAEGSESEDSQGSGDDDEDDESGDDVDTSTGPSGDDVPASEAEDSQLKMTAAAIEAAVDAVLSSPDTEAPGRMAVKFTPTITKQMMDEYQKDVDAGNEANGLAKLIGAALSEALEVYDEKRVLPIETTQSEARRNAANDKRIAAWAAANPQDAANPHLWQRMVERYNGYVAKSGARRADRVTMEQLAILAKADLPADKRKGAGAKGSPAPSTPESQKKAAIAAGKTPGSIGVVAPKATTPAKGKVGHEGAAYREHLKSGSRDLW